MDLDNGTPFPAAFKAAINAKGREHVVVVVKVSFAFPESPKQPCPIREAQEPLLMADTFWGEPGLSVPRREMDFALSKANCDVLVEGSAPSPGGRPVERLRAGLRVGRWVKSVNVHGDRVWLSGVGLPTISNPRPFVSMPLSYNRAFGGVDRSDPEDESPPAFAANPVGRGWHAAENVGHLNGQPLPNLENAYDPIKTPWGSHAPAALGPVGRGWSGRLRYAGTYDQEWIDNVFPFLPSDFDPRYYQAVADDQQIPSPVTGTEVVLINMTPDGKTGFRLPDTTLPFVFSRQFGGDVHRDGHMDTLFINAKERRFTMSWRASLPLRRDLFEVKQCIIGRRRKGFWRARKLGKRYYPSLRDLTAARGSEDAE